MATLINQAEIERLVLKTLQEDMDVALDRATDRVLKEMADTVRRNVAARMIALVSSEYNVEYNHDELRIRVRIES